MDDLFQAAKAASAKCHAPYSNYPVGAAIRTASGTIHAGCNIENVSFPEGWCAETSAIAHMVMAGENENCRGLRLCSEGRPRHALRRLPPAAA